MICPHCGNEVGPSSKGTNLVIDDNGKWKNREGEDLEKEMASFVIMNDSESVIQVWDGNTPYIAQDGTRNIIGDRSVLAVLTDYRLIIIEVFGFMTTRYELFRSLDLEDIKGVQVHEGLARTVILISHSTNGTTGETELYNMTVHNDEKISGSLNFTATAKTREHAEGFRSLVVAAIRLRKEFLKRDSKKTIVLDFGELASQLAKGGIVVQVVRCPACGANMGMPTEGETVTCQYCHTTSTAVDLFKKLTESILEIRK